MLDINRIESDFDFVCEQLNKRQKDFTNDLKIVLDLNNKRKELIKEVEELKAQKNKISKEIGILARENKTDEIEKIKTEVTNTGNKIDSLDEQLKNIVEQLNSKLAEIPNVPNENMPVGKDDQDNPEIRRWEEPGLKKSDLAHWDIGQKLNLVNFELGAKISGSRFLVYENNGSKMIRAIADILLNKHKSNGYKEMWLPLLVNSENMYGTGQLPKFEEDAYKVDDQYLIPTSEVPLTNVVRNEILDHKQLPMYLTAFTQCFRREAGSAGRDTKGMIRLHQFNKVEMVKIVHPNNSYQELESMVNDAEECLKMFEVPYRVVELCTGDVGFSSQKTYDLEVWFPEQNKFREISSCSNCGDFQARRMQARFKNEEGKIEYLHTLNGSGLAIDRLFAAMIENHFDGEKLYLPKVLRPYFDNQEYLK
ncbi:serine--tRNA ligase [Spiroplasma culicicola]|uniref:Serine--tRNA ligase n=1 Tax=Spiroplasma culicicola AES-1 TaxID=1276246 RepID=W6A5Y0_9MOLU|nr:serine--tRNA ligase [Spiroplasma culicicola]AHI52346.1 seryl-tRNA synthetase [Spiroplasma culicicola AES-1]